MKNYLSKHILLTISVTSFILILIPLSIFLFHFRGNPISSDLSDWALFGDYIGGTLNTIIALASLVILGLLTHNIGKQSNEENKKVNLLLRKYDSYDKLSQYLTDMEMMHITGTLELNRFRTASESEEKIYYKQKFDQKVEIFFALHGLLLSFEKRFGHLYDYHFKSEEYISLISLSEKIKNAFVLIVEDKLKQEEVDPFVSNYSEFYDQFQEFLEKLIFELK